MNPTSSDPSPAVPAIQPLGFDWKIGVGLIGSVAAREVFVSTSSSVIPSKNSHTARIPRS